MSAVGFIPAENLVGPAKFLFFSTDGSAAWWEVWKWPFAIRYSRLLHGIQGEGPSSPNSVGGRCE
jgi:signal peptidase I